MKKLAIIAIALVTLMSILIATPVYADADTQVDQASEEAVVGDDVTDSSNESNPLGLLANLQGIWYGQGWNVVAIPMRKLQF